MLYNGLDLILYFFIYSFLGWCIEVSVLAVSRHRFGNRGIFNAPICISYGIIMVLMIVTSSGSQDTPVFHFIMCYSIATVIDTIGGHITRRFVGRPVWDYIGLTALPGRLRGLLISLGAAALFFMTLQLVHPFIYAAVSLLPLSLLRLVCRILLILFLLDFLFVLFTAFAAKHYRKSELLKRDPRETKRTIGYSIYLLIWKRLEKAYPVLTEGSLQNYSDDALIREGITFAPGLGFDKIFWVFLISALLGDIIETLFVHGVSHVWMRRSSLVFGPFSVVWGIGAAILTVVLIRLRSKEDRYIFIGGFFLGGTYEYLCSVFTQVVFGKVFWDYSDMKFNIGGRTNLLFMIFWGILSLVWVKFCYPRLSSFIERIPPLLGKILTWSLLLLMSLDILLTAAVMIRGNLRKTSPVPANAIEVYLDDTYPDETIRKLWPNMR